MRSPYTTRQNACQLASSRQLLKWAGDGPYWCFGTIDRDLPEGRRYSPVAIERGDYRKLQLFIQRNQHLDLYFSPNTYDAPDRTDDSAGVPMMLFADGDKVNPKKCPVRPNCVVETSPGRYQFYWYLTKQLSRESWRTLNRDMTYFVGADKGGWPLNKLLRIPLTRNHKYPGNPVGKILWNDGDAYDPDDLRKKIPHRNGKNGNGHDSGGDAAARAWRRLGGRMSPSLRHALRTSTKPDDRSKAQYRLECELAEIGATSAEIKSIIAGCTWQKFDGDKLDDEVDRVADAKGLDEPLITPKAFVVRPVPPMDFLYGRYYVRGLLSSTSAAGGVGKTRLVVAEILSMVTGIPLLWVKPKRPLRVWYIGEEPDDSFQRQMQAAMQHYGITEEQIGGRLMSNSMREVKPVIVHQKGKGCEINLPMVDAITTGIINYKIDVTFLDPFIKSHNVNENDNVAIETAASQWGDIAHDTKCAVMLLHHTRKGNGREVTQDDSRGAGSFINECRINRVAQAGEYVEWFRVDQGKANDIKESGESEWFHMHDVKLANGDNVGVAVREELQKWTATVKDRHLTITPGEPPARKNGKAPSNGRSKPRRDRSGNDQRAIDALATLGHATMGQWHKASGMPYTTIYDARTRLVEQRRVRQVGDQYSILQ
jgi:hypothetical protein